MIDIARAMSFLRQTNLIGGRWMPVDDGAKLDVTDPATGEVIGVVPCSGAPETRRAVAAAFPGWAAKTAGERANPLLAMANAIRENADALAELLTLEQGNPLAESKGEEDDRRGLYPVVAEEARRV